MRPEKPWTKRCWHRLRDTHKHNDSTQRRDTHSAEHMPKFVATQTERGEGRGQGGDQGRKGDDGGRERGTDGERGGIE